VLFNHVAINDPVNFLEHIPHLREHFGLIANDPTTKNKWWPLTDACQVVLKGTPTGQHWLPIEQVMHLD